MKSVFLLLVILILGAAAFMARSDWWIVPGINRWQANMMGDNKYFPVLTVFILALPPIILLGLLKFVLSKNNRP